jgi:hypothetical protein
MTASSLRVDTEECTPSTGLRRLVRWDKLRVKLDEPGEERLPIDAPGPYPQLPGHPHQNGLAGVLGEGYALLSSGTSGYLVHGWRQSDGYSSKLVGGRGFGHPGLLRIT